MIMLYFINFFHFLYNKLFKNKAKIEIIVLKKIITNCDLFKLLFENKCNVIKLLKLYQVSQMEYKRNNRLTPDVGSSREKDLIAYMKYILKDKINYKIDNEKEEDVLINNTKVSIKHSSTKSLSSSSIKIQWTENKIQQTKFINDFEFTCDLMIVFVRFNNNNSGEIEILYNLSATLNKIMKSFKDNDIQIFKTRENSNGRGIEFSTIFFKAMVTDSFYHIKVVFNDLTTNSNIDCIERRIRKCKN